MNRNPDYSRREIVAGLSVLGTTAIAGCADLADAESRSQNDDVQDSDGDGVIDSQDYAPQDPEVQAKNDLESTKTRSSDFENADLDDFEGENTDIENSDTPTEDDGERTHEWRAEDLFPNPEVTEIRHPEPRAVSITDEHQQGDWYDFQATVENTGIAGDIGLTLVLLREPDDDLYSLGSKEIRSQRLYFSENERRTVEMRGKLEDGYKGYGFRLWAAEVEADVKNGGGQGMVEVELLNKGGLGGHDALIQEKTVEMKSESMRTVKFEGDFDNFIFEDATVEASIPD